MDLQVLGGHSASERPASVFISLLPMQNHRIPTSLLDIHAPQHMFLRLERCRLVLSFSQVSREQSGREAACALEVKSWASQFHSLCRVPAVCIRLSCWASVSPSAHLCLSTISPAPGCYGDYKDEASQERSHRLVAPSCCYIIVDDY